MTTVSEKSASNHPDGALQSSRMFGAPYRYIQGPGALSELGGVLEPFGGEPVLIMDGIVYDMVGKSLDCLTSQGLFQPRLQLVEGELTYAAIDRLVQEVGSHPSVIVGIGGGKILDTAKALARRLERDVITVPTVASNDSPTSAAIAMYDDEHVLISVDRLRGNPMAVVVDTTLIASAPPMFLKSGIGDAISKKFEAEACLAGSGVTPFGTRPLRTGVAIADAAYQTLRDCALDAMTHAGKGTTDANFEATVEAVILMSGVGFENGGLSLAHSLTRGLTRLEGAREVPHGQQIAWATLVHLAAEGRPDGEIVDLQGFLRSLHLPVSLQEMNCPPTLDSNAQMIARFTMTAPHLLNFPLTLDQERIVEAIKQIEQMANNLAK